MNLSLKHQKNSLSLLVGIVAFLVTSSSCFADATRAAWMQGKYGIFVHFLRGINNIPYADNGPYGSPTSWSTVVQNFNTDTFANDVYRTGASFVVFTLGQNDGYYCAGNQTYRNFTGQTGYDSDRNLILAIWQSLQTIKTNTGKDIKLIVYLASVGPYAGPTELCGINPTTDQGLNCQNGLGANNAKFRDRFNLMVREWSVGFGAAVSGWWLDGAYAYWNFTGDASASPIYTQPTDGTNGLTNLNALIDACRYGNGNAAVCVNTLTTYNMTGPYGYTSHADFTAGDFVGPLYRTPWNSNTVSVTDLLGTGTGTLQWCMTSHLGTSWGTQDTQYSDTRIANYVYFVTKANGTLCIDMGVNADGSLAATQLTQMDKVKAAVAGSYTDYSATDASGATLTNLTAFKPSWYTNHAGTTELPVNSVYNYMSYGNDNDATTTTHFALAANEWAYSYRVDLGDIKRFNYYVLTMGASNYATTFAIEGSSDGTTWVELLRNTAGIGGRNEGYLISTYEYRYVRAKSIAPSAGPTQMAIVEFELYNTASTLTSVTSSSPAKVVWSDAMNETGYTIERKTGTSGTYAQVGTSAANVTTFWDTSVASATTYIYRVKPSNGIYSNEKSVTTPTFSTLVNDNFNAITTGAAPTGWTVSAPANTTASVQAFPSASNKSVLLYDNSTSGLCSAQKTFTATSDWLFASFKFYATTNGSAFQLRSGSSVAVDLFLKSGSLVYRNASGTETSIMTYSVNTWYSVKIVPSVSLKTFDLYVGGVLKVKGAAFRTASVSNINTIYFGSDTAAKSSTYVDDVFIQK
jgi:hypothetical protein